MGTKTKKSTRKFEKKSLGPAIAKRKMGQKRKIEQNKKDVKAVEREGEKTAKKAKFNADEKEADKAKKIENLDVDAFLEGNYFENESDVEADDLSDSGDEAGEGDAGDDGEGGEGDAEGVNGGGDSDSDIDSDLDEEALHKQMMATMQKNDPSFVKHLEKSNSALLHFEGTEVKAEEEDEEEDEQGAEKQEEELEDEESSSKKKKKTTEFTMSNLNALKVQVVKEKSRSALKRLVKVFRAAAHIADDAKQGQEDDDVEKSSTTFKSAKVYQALVRFCMEHFAPVMSRHLGELGPSKKNPSWSAFSNVLRSYLASVLHMLSKVLDITMVRSLLGHLEAMVPFLEPFPKLATKLVKTLLGIWASSEEDARIDAFLRIRQMCVTLPARDGILENCLKGIYLTYVRSSNFMSLQSTPTVLFMANCVVELYSLEPGASYQHAFVYLRQLAIHLRNAITTKTKESHKGVYNWKYINCLRVFSLLLAAHGSKPGSYLYPLIYPFVQVCLGVIDLLPSARYFPLRLTCAKFLVDLSEKSGTYIPLSPYLIHVLQAAELQKRPKKTSAKMPPVQYLLKVSKPVIGTKDYQEKMVGEALSLLVQHLAVHSYSVSFPELAVPIKMVLKKLKKSSKVVRVKKQIVTFLDKVEANSTFIAGKRAALDHSPADFLTKKLDFKKLLQADKQSVVSPLEKYFKMQQKDEVDGPVLSAEAMEQSKPKKRAEQEEDEEEEDYEEEEEYEEDAEEGGEDEGEDDGEEDDDVEEMEMKVPKKRNIKLSGDDPEDKMDDFVLSESENDEEEEQDGGEEDDSDD